MRDFQSKYQQHEDKHTNYRDPINKSDESEQDQEDEIASKLHDASKFMAQSNTEQAVSFWKKQVMHLQGKLKSIQSKRKKKVVPLLNFKPNEECDTAHNSENPSCNYVSMQENGTIAKPTFANMGTDPIKQNINQRDSFSMKAIYPRSYSRAFERQIKNDLPIINVISPANLPSGYTFEAGMGNKKFLALVPFGGTKKGEIFSTPMISLDTVQIPVPIGRWRDHFCHLFVHGICHPLVFCSLFFPQIGLGQILTRNHLDWLGHDGTKSATKNACASITTLYLSWLVINALAMYVVVYENWYRRGFPPQRIDYIIMGVLNGIFVLYTLYAVSCARRNIRKKYAIEENVCIGCEDCCCATFCTSCSIAQMGRHTGNFDTIRAVLCSKTGIPSHVDVTPGPRFDDVEEGNVGGGFVQMK